MKKLSATLLFALPLLSVFSCSGDTSKVITVAASEIPHAEILNNAVKPLLQEKGYELKVTTLDWTLQNDAVKNGEYDANYFQHRPYLQQFDSGSSTYSTDYKYTSLFPTAAIHFEPLRIYPGKKTAAEFEASKLTATYEICSDVSNEIRALELLKNAGVIASYDVDEKGNPINLPSNITTIDENLLVSSLGDYDYAVLPTNSALTGKLTADETLPVESDSVKDRNANVIAASVTRYAEDTTYKTKIDVLTDALLSKDVSTFIQEHYQGVVVSVQQDLR